MTTEELIEKLKTELLVKLNAAWKQCDEARAEIERITMEFAAANSEIEKLNKERDELSVQLDEFRNDYGNALADVESLKRDLAQAISERTPHDYGLLKHTIEGLKQELHESRAEVAQLRAERDLAQQLDCDKATVKQQLTVRPEPSRLEIAAMLLSGFAASDTSVIHNKYNFVLTEADALIATAREGAK